MASSPFLGLGLSLALVAAADTALTGDGEPLLGLNVLRTGGGESILSLTLPFQVPTTPARLSFEFGFATDERLEPDTFFDSFSLTLRTSDAASTALLLTSDLFGVRWAPDNPFGLMLDPDSIERRAIPFPAFGAALERKSSFSASLLLPLGFLGHSTTLFVDLFDNQNARGSLGYVDHLKISSDSKTNLPPHLILQSSASVAGPFADEDEAVPNPGDQSCTVPELERTRFYRIRADSQIELRSSRSWGINRFTTTSSPSPIVILESAALVEGPYTDEPSAQVNLRDRTITARQASSMRFYRVRSNVRVRIVRQRQAGDIVVFGFEYQPLAFTLQSSPVVEGPYADESGFKVNSASQTMTLSRFPRARFYRIRSDVPRTITGIRRVGGTFVISHGQPGGEVVLQAAPAVTGPYQDDNSAQIDLVKRTIASPATGAARFYRIRSAVPLRIIRLRVNGDQALLNYE